MGSRSAELLLRLAEGPPIVSDGGMGSELLKRGWQGATDDANLHAPETVEEIHRAFVSAGAELILTNTFMAPVRPEVQVEDALAAGVARARAAAGGAFVAASLGPRDSWRLDASRRLIARLKTVDVDAVWFETGEIQGTGMSLNFLRALGAELPHPVFVSFVPDGAAPLAIDWFRTHAPRVFSIGLNCGKGPAAALESGRAQPAGMPGFSLRPSAGLPTGEGRSLEWPVPPAAFGDFAEAAHGLRARIIGGCCGASPAHIAAVADRLRVLPNSSQS